MANYQPGQALTGWTGDCASLLTEMKRQAGVRTDRELASFMGVAQSTVAYWRSRAKVPESAILKFERMVEAGGQPAAARAIAARMVVMRLAEYWYQHAARKGATGGREIFYGAVALSFHTLTDAVFQQLLTYEEATRKEPFDIARTLLEDTAFLDRLLEWLKTVPAHVTLAREARTPPTVHLGQSPQSSPQSPPLEPRSDQPPLNPKRKPRSRD